MLLSQRKVSNMASKRHIRKNMCTGKYRYQDTVSAEKARNWATSHYKQPFTYYRCQFCKGYHIGHNFQRERKTF